ncbi:hypothetical protein [Streptomyces rhizosphaericus]|uniref:hypothetical protein n=1 Tax=Streptomyces rhizosphaericus TaxID=114699 RepID=UPI000A3741CD
MAVSDTLPGSAPSWSALTKKPPLARRLLRWAERPAGLQRKKRIVPLTDCSCVALMASVASAVSRSPPPSMMRRFGLSFEAMTFLKVVNGLGAG